MDVSAVGPGTTQTGPSGPAQAVDAEPCLVLKTQPGSNSRQTLRNNVIKHSMRGIYGFHGQLTLSRTGSVGEDRSSCLRRVNCEICVKSI